MRRVILESPFAGETYEQIEANVAYAQRAMMDAIQKGECPIASHLLYTQVLDDGDPESRQLGMVLGFEWLHVVHGMVVYTDRGVSSGMKAGISRAGAIGLPIEYRSLGERHEDNPNG